MMPAPRKPMPGHDLRGDARWAGVSRDQAREHHEACSPDGDERVGPQARHALAPLTLESDRAAEQGRGAEIDGVLFDRDHG